jgi:SPOR domain
MRNKSSALFLAAVPLLCALFVPQLTWSQAPAAQREFHHSKAEVDKAIQDLRPTLNGRLPILEGFVEKSAELSDRLTRGYYECSIQETAKSQGVTDVQVVAKITVWYTDPDPTKSGYRVLPSNGRLEADVLDRIVEALDPGQASPGPASLSANSPPVNSQPATPPVLSMPRDVKILPSVGGSTPIRPNPSSSSSASTLTLPPRNPVVDAGKAAPDDIEALKRRREESEARAKELSEQIQNLEEILRNQSHPSDIAVVRKSGTRVVSKPSAEAPVLFSAEAEDEFPVLDTNGAWVHVQISGVSRGWIRRTDLNMPEAMGGNSNKEAASAPVANSPFRVVREETGTFKGGWEPLKGQSVKIIWTEPDPSLAKAAGAKARQDFSKSLFIKTYRELSSQNQGIAGVVIIFDAADGGQIAATFENLKQWQTGALTEASFWQTCLVDPAELLQSTAEPAESSPSSGDFAVQVGTFAEEANAKRLRDRLLERYQPIFIQEFNGPSGRLYSVCVGLVPSPQAAEQLATQLRNSDGFQTLVIRVDAPSPMSPKKALSTLSSQP